MSIIIFDPFNRFIWPIIITLLVIEGIYLIQKGLKNSSRSEKLIMVGYSFIFISFAISRILEYFSGYFLAGYYNNHTYISNIHNSAEIYGHLNFLSKIIWFMGIFLFFLIFDMVIQRTKFLPTIFNIFFFILILFEQTLFWLLLGLDICLFFILFVLFSKEASIKFQNITAFILIAFILFWLSSFIESKLVKQLGLVSPSYPMLLAFVGVLISFSVIMLADSFLILSLLLVFPFFISIFNYNLHFEIFISFSIGFGIFLSMIIFSFTRLIRYLKALELEEELVKKSEESHDLITAITTLKPKKMTEEEITFYKEQKLCLVCKGKIIGFTYICINCEAMYCGKCAKALIQIENSCWACDSPLDKSKPIKKCEKVPSEEIFLEEDHHKNSHKKQKILD